MMLVTRDNEMRAEGDLNRMKKDAEGMYAAGLKPDVIASIQETTVEAVREMLGIQPVRDKE